MTAGTEDITRLQVALGERSYPIFIGEGTLARLPAEISSIGAKGMIGLVTDSNVGPLYGERVVALLRETGRQVAVCVLPAGEMHKRLEAIEEICGAFLEAGLDRSSLIVALGGGVVGDIAGFAAAVFMRGIPFVQVPTTIVAQVDSSVGGKTGVNHPLSKNSIGAFHQPRAVIIDVSLLQSLPPRELSAGLAEAVKHGIIADADLFGYMEEHAAAILSGNRDLLRVPIVRSCEIKGAIVSADEHEGGIRANLNYGHTFGHAIEAVTSYEMFLHGEAISLGMVCAGALSRSLGLVGEDFCRRQEACLRAYGLPVRWPAIPIDDTLALMKKDKKSRAGTLKFIVAERLGAVSHRTEITEAQARAALGSLCEAE